MPVEASVAAIFEPICPLLPTPVTITRPLITESVSTALANGSARPAFRASASAAMPACSVVTVRSADAIAACRPAAVLMPPECMADALSAFGRFCPTLRRLERKALRSRPQVEFNRPLTIRIYGSASIGAACAATAFGWRCRTSGQSIRDARHMAFLARAHRRRRRGPWPDGDGARAGDRPGCAARSPRPTSTTIC